MFFKNLKILGLNKAKPNIHIPIKNSLKKRIIYNIPSPHILANYPKLFQITNRFYSSNTANPDEIETNPDPFPRTKREEFSAPCKFCLIPETWFSFFHKRTGVTGFYTFVVTTGTYLFSKEIYVMEHEFYTGLSMILLCVVFVKSIGPGLSKYLDKEIDRIETDWNTERNDTITNLNSGIENEKMLQWSIEGELLLLDAKRKSVLMQLEYIFRERQMMVHKSVTRLLDYHIVLNNIYTKYWRKNMIEWITTQVMKDATLDQEAKTFEACLMQIQLAADEYYKNEASDAAKKTPDK